MNKDCERCLLQVAEDLANLTPVKIEVLLALAPIPQSNSQTSVQQENEKKGSSTGVQEPKVTVLEPIDDQVKRRKSTKKSTDGKKSKETESSKGSKSSKLKDDNNNLDAEKQKIKSSQQQSKNSLNQDSDYVSEEPISLSRKSDTDRGSRSTINQSIGDLNDKQQQSTSLRNEVVRKPSVKGTIQKQVNNNSTTTGSSDKLKNEQPKEQTISKKPEEVVSSSSISLVRKPSTKTKTASSTKTSSNASLTTNKETKDNLKDSSSSREPVKEIIKDASKDNTNKDNTSKDNTSKDNASKDNVKDTVKESTLKESLNNKEPVSTSKKSLVSQQSIETERTEDDQSTKEVAPVRTQTQSKIGDAKRIFEKPRRQESIEREKQERIILLNKVSDVKNKFERRASVNAASAIWNKTSSERKKSITDNEQTVKPTPVVSNTAVQKAINSTASPPTEQAAAAANSLPKVTSSTRPSTNGLKDDAIKPTTSTTSISTIKPKLVNERQVSVSSSTNNPPTGNDRSNLKVRRHTVKAKTNSTTAVPTIAELKRKDLFSIKEKPSIIETIKENEIANQTSTTPPQTPVAPQASTTKTSPFNISTEQSQQSISSKSTPPPTPSLNNTQTIRSPTPTDQQPATTAVQITPASPVEKQLKLKILNTTSQPTLPSKLFNSGSALNSNQSASFLVQSPSIKSTTSQDSVSGSTLNSASASKLAPIARSYKKISFTKDGATITETGRIISEETPSGTKITKKIITKKSTTPSAYDGSSRNQQSFDSETDEYTANTLNDTHHNRTKSRSGNLMNAYSNSSNLSSNVSSSNVRKSDSTSSSGSVDIFDDIFDTWVGDNPMFNNISGKFKSLFNQPGSSLFGNSSSFGRNSKANFPSFLNRSKPTLAKGRAESCERKYNDENQLNSVPSSGSGILRRPGYSTEGESDTDNEEMNGQNVGLWKFLNPNMTSRLLNKHPSLMNGMDFFNNDDGFSNRSRDRLKFDSKPPTFLSNRFKSASRDLADPNDTIFKTTFTIRPNGSTKIVTTTSRNNSGTNLAGPNIPNVPNIQMFSKNNMTSSTPASRFVERMNSEQPIDMSNSSQQVFEFEPAMNTEFKANFPLTIGRIRSQNSQIGPQVNSPFSTPRAFNRSTSAQANSARIDPARSFMDADSYRGLKMQNVHEIPVVEQNVPVRTAQKEHYIPIIRQSSAEQENSLLDQLKTHGYRNVVNQRNSKVNSNQFGVPIEPPDEQATVANNKSKIGKNGLLNEPTMHDSTNRTTFKSLTTNTKAIDSMNALDSLTNGHSLNHLNSDRQITPTAITASSATTNHFVSDYHISKKPNHKSHNQLTSTIGDQPIASKEPPATDVDCNRLLNVARELNFLDLNRKSTNKLTAKYSSLSSKSLEHLNSFDLTKASLLFKNISLTTKTDHKPYKTKEPNDEIIIYGSDEDDAQLKEKLLSSDQSTSSKRSNARRPKIERTKSIDNEEDESITRSSTESAFAQTPNHSSTDLTHHHKNGELNDLKDDYLNCSINNQVNQIQQLIQLLYAEHEDEPSKSETRPNQRSKTANQFKEDNYQLLRKTQSDLKELKNDLQILQLKNKLKRRLTEQKGVQKTNVANSNNHNRLEKERNYSSIASTDTSTTNTVTPTSDEDDETYRKSSLKSSFKSLPPLPPLAKPSSSIKSTSSYLNSNLNPKSDRLNDNLINQSNQRMMDDDCCLTVNKSKFNDSQTTVPQHVYQKTNSLMISQLNKEHESNTKPLSSSNTKHNAFSRSASSLNGYQSAYLRNNGHLDGSFHNATNANSSPTNANSSPTSSNSELTRRSTIGSSKETVQERILRKSFYTRFQSPDRQTSIDNPSSSSRIRRKLNDDLDDYLTDTNRRRNLNSISKSISNGLENDDDDDLTNTAKPISKRSGYNRRTSHSPYRTSVQNDSNNDDLSDEELLKSLSSINRRNSFAYGSSTALNRFPSLQASFERNLSSAAAKLDDTKKEFKNYSSTTKLLNESKRNSIAHIDYDSNNNLFRNGLGSSLRSKLNGSNSDLLHGEQSTDQASRRNQLRKSSDRNDSKSSSTYGLNFYNNFELST